MIGRIFGALFLVTGLPIVSGAVRGCYLAVESCAWASTTDQAAHSTGQTTQASADMRAAAEAGKDKVSLPFGNMSGGREKLGYGVKDAKGNLTVEVASGVHTDTGATGITANSNVPSGAVFGIHGHIDCDQPFRRLG